MRQRNILITDKIISAIQLRSGGTKTIYDIGDGYVIARMGSEELINSEINMAKKLSHLGLYTQEFEKAIATINGFAEPVLKMKSFTTLAAEGKQVRDRKNHESSCGDTLLFDNIHHLKDKEHWQKILKHIADDIYLYLVNNFAFSADAFNLLIKDTEQTVKARAASNSKLFSDLAQDIHLFFFDFGDTVYIEEKNYNFIDAKGEILMDSIRACINNLSVTITDTIFHAVSDETYEKILHRYPGCTTIIDLKAESENAFQPVWNELIEDVSSRIKHYLENMPIPERKTAYLTPFMQWNADVAARHAEEMGKINKQNEKFRLELEKQKAIYKLWEAERLAEEVRLTAINQQFRDAMQNKLTEKPETKEPNPARSIRCTIQ